MTISLRFSLGLLIGIAGTVSMAQTSVLPPDAVLHMPVGGLERTDSKASVVPAPGQPFRSALKVIVRKPASETNATQLTIPIAEAVEKGDVLLATFWLRGASADGRNPARIEFLFERTENPWTKSVTQGAAASRNPNLWRKVIVPFRAAESYGPREAMTSLRFALQPQTVEVGGLEVLNYRKTTTLDALTDLAISGNPLGRARVAIDLRKTRQILQGLGGNFCQPRYGSTEAMDAVGRYVLGHLNVRHARIGLPLEQWYPAPDVYRDTDQARASLLTLQEMARRKIPTVVSVWEGPGWMLGGSREQSGRTLPPAMYGECIKAIGHYLVTARDRYHAPVQYFSFNEPDSGVNFRFTPSQMADFIRQAGPQFAALGLKTKFLVGDTANGTNFYEYAKPLLEDRTIAPYLGPLAFHCWDALSASDLSYTRIAELGRQYKKPVWCLEAGHDSALWQAADPWGSWENGLRTALAYERTLRLTGASLIDYWTYQDNYPLVDKQSVRPYPVFHVMEQLQDVVRPNYRVASSRSNRDDLQVLATSGPRRGFGVLLVNPVGAGAVTIAGLPPRSKVVIGVSDKTSQRRSRTAVVGPRGELQLALPTRSVISIRSQ
jgi:hypothetical protein